jgi:pyruvate/2-oxoglutarate dehydrogenase complex dihydrolipoamide dehydrogenase (E3) component
VTVAGDTLRFKRAVIATGARAAAPPIPGLDTVPYLTNETLFSLTERPERLGIIGAGPIGCEMAQAFARLGSEVVLVASAHDILPREDRDAADVVLQALKNDGVTLRCCGKDLAVSLRDDSRVRLSVASQGEAYEEVVDTLLVAVGRAPNVENLGLEKAGVAFSPKGVQVDDRLRTTHPKIFAAGDICSPYQFTHAADFMARIVIQNALFFGRAKASALTIPWCTYTVPELAHVGLNEDQARDKHVAIDTFTQAFQDVDRSILEGDTAGFVRVHVRQGTDTIVGATVVGAGAGNLISEITLAMTHGLGLKKIGSTIHPYPTQADAIRRVGDLYNRTRLTPRVKAAMKTLIKWRR